MKMWQAPLSDKLFMKFDTSIDNTQNPDIILEKDGNKIKLSLNGITYEGTAPILTKKTHRLIQNLLPANKTFIFTGNKTTETLTENSLLNLHYSSDSVYYKVTYSYENTIYTALSKSYDRSIATEANIAGAIGIGSTANPIVIAVDGSMLHLVITDIPSQNKFTIQLYEFAGTTRAIKILAIEETDGE